MGASMSYEHISSFLRIDDMVLHKLWYIYVSGGCLPSYSVMLTQVRAKHKSSPKKAKAHTLMERRVFEDITKPIHPVTFTDYDSCLGKQLARRQEEVCVCCQYFLLHQIWRKQRYLVLSVKTFSKLKFHLGIKSKITTHVKISHVFAYMKFVSIQ